MLKLIKPFYQWNCDFSLYIIFSCSKQYRFRRLYQCLTTTGEKEITNGAEELLNSGHTAGKFSLIDFALSEFLAIAHTENLAFFLLCIIFLRLLSSIIIMITRNMIHRGNKLSFIQK